MDVTSISAMHVRLIRLLPLDLARQIHPKAVHDLVATAVANGWTDAEWLATVALEGTGHQSVRDAAGVFMSRLRDVAEMPCPQAQTTTPAKLPEEFFRPVDPPSPEQLHAHIAAARADLTARRGVTDPESDPSTVRRTA